MRVVTVLEELAQMSAGQESRRVKSAHLRSVFDCQSPALNTQYTNRVGGRTRQLRIQNATMVPGQMRGGTEVRRGGRGSCDSSDSGSSEFHVNNAPRIRWLFSTPGWVKRDRTAWALHTGHRILTFVALASWITLMWVLIRTSGNPR